MASLALPLVGQVSPFVDSPTFGGTKLFSDGLSSAGSAPKTDSSESFFAFVFALGDQGAGKFMSHLDNLSAGAPDKIDAAVMGLRDASWGLRSRAYGLTWRDSGVRGYVTTIALTREEMTSLWADVVDRDLVDFDVRRSVLERFALSYSSNGDSSVYYGCTLRIERWKTGGEYVELGLNSPNAGFETAKGLLDFNSTSDKNLTYAIDVFMGWEIASGLRLGAQSNRLMTRHLWDVEEKPQYRAGAQIDLGSSVQLTLETDINKAMRMPFPLDQKTAAASLKINANKAITFAVGVEQKTMNDQKTTVAGLNVWLNGKNNRLGVGFQFGQDTMPWGATWKMQ
jgi:hypothetical protein